MFFYKKLKYLLEYCIFLCLITIFRSLGIVFSSDICGFLARKFGRLFSVTDTARKNIIISLGDNVDVDQIIENLWDNYGRYIGEFAFINKLSKEEVDRRVKITGAETIQYYKDKNQPILICLAHTANWDFVICKIEEIYGKCSIIYRKMNNPYIDKYILDTRSSNAEMIKKSTAGMFKLTKSMKNGRSAVMLIDQKMNSGIEVPFFNRPAMTSDSIAKLSLKYNFPIIPCQIIRKKGCNFEIIVHKKLDYDNTGDIKIDSYNIMLKLHSILESWISSYPGQWFWFHNRWKDK